MKKQIRRGNDRDPDIPAYIINERDWNYFEAFAMRGGWREALRRVGAAWGENAVRLILVNVVWACALFSIVGIPPATMLLFLTARRALNHEPLTYDMGLYGVGRYARQSWGWALPLLLGGLLMYGALWGVREQGLPPAVGWATQALFIGWLGFNLYYPALWWHTIPEQRAVGANWGCIAAYWRQYPLMALAGVGVVALLATLTVLSGWFFLFLLLLFTPITCAMLATALIGAYAPRR